MSKHLQTNTPETWGSISNWRAIEDFSPVISGQTTFVTTIDNPIPISTITSYISAYDETDGNLTHRIELVDDARDFAIMFYGSMTQQGIEFTPSLTMQDF